MSYRKDQLFFEPEDAGMSKLGTNLGKDTQLWSQQIKVTFEKELSPLIRAGGKPFLNFTYKDLPKATALGGITITVGGRIMLFPVIVKDNELAPFDIFYDQLDKEWHFLTPDRVDRLTSNYSPYQGLTTNIPSDAVENTVDGSYGQPSWRDPLDHRVVQSSLNMERMKEMAEYLDSNPQVLVTMEPKVAHMLRVYGEAALHMDDVIKEAAFKNASPIFEHSVVADVAMVSKKDVNLYEIKVSSRKSAGVFKALTSAEGVRKIAEFFEKNADKILDEVDSTGSTAISRGIAAPPRIISSVLDPDPRTQRDVIGSSGTYTVTLETGRSDTGVVLPIEDWNGEDTGSYIFISPDNFAISNSIFGKRAPVNHVLPRGPYSQGSLGVFIKETEGLNFSTWPLRIEEVWGSPEAGTQIKAVDTRNVTKLNLVITDAVKVPTRIDPSIAPDLIEHGRINVYLPDNMKFSPLPEGDQVKLASTVESSVLREEARFETDHPEYGMYEVTKKAGYGRMFTIHEKKASLDRSYSGNSYRDEEIPERSSGNATHVDFILKTAGVDIGADTLDKMVIGERLTVFTPGKPSEPVGDIRKVAAAEIHRRTNAIASDIKPISPGLFIKLANALCRVNGNEMEKIASMCRYPMLVKVAEDTGDTSINQLLNLNFLGEENIDYFVDRLDVLDTVEDVLTRLLVVARISNLGINPDDVKDALRGLAATKEKFEQVKRLRMAW